MRPERHRGGAESVKSKIGHLASYARIAIHIREFSPGGGKMTRRTRNKIAQVRRAALRVLLVLTPANLLSQDLDPRVEES
jgi:hypothetical protein